MEFFRKNRWVLVVGAIILVVLLGLVIRRGRINAADNGFQTQQIERGNLKATIGATGTVRAKQSAVLVWQVAGNVDTVNAVIGDNVPAGYILAYLSKTSLPQSVILAEADLASAKMTLDDLVNSDTALAQSVIALRDAQEKYDTAYNWRRELDNDRITVREITYKRIGTIQIPQVKEYKTWADETTRQKAQEDLDLAQAQLEDAKRTYERLAGGNEAEISAAEARVAAAEATLNLSRIIAPFAGTVTEAYPLPGDLVGAGALAYRVDDLSSLLVDVEVSEVDINSVELGQEASLSFDAILDKKYSGKVVKVSSVGNTVNGVVNFTVTVELTDVDQFVKPGMTAAVNITVTELNDVLLVPNRSVRVSDGNRVVYLMVGGQPVKTEIRLGPSDNENSVIASGNVEEGDLVILNPPTEFPGPGGGPRNGGFGD